MKTIDFRLSEESHILLKSLIGKELEIVVFDDLPNAATTAYGMVSLVSDGCRYYFSNFLESHEYINRAEDISILKFGEIADTEFEGFLEGRKPITHIINQRIKTIKIVNDNQKLYSNGNPEFNIFNVCGVVIELEDSREVSFEKSILFSEFIMVKTRYDLINSFASLDEFYEEWSNSKYTAEAKREVVLLE